LLAGSAIKGATAPFEHNLPDSPVRIERMGMFPTGFGQDDADEIDAVSGAVQPGTWIAKVDHLSGSPVKRKSPPNH
jgi:hypothetical protein